MPHITQEEAVENYLRAGNTLTRIECLNLFHSIELPRIVFDLKVKGVPIESEIVKGENGKRYSRYFIRLVKVEASGQLQFV